MLETLAAVALLSLLAMATVPLVSRAASSVEQGGNRWEARRVLDEVVAPADGRQRIAMDRTGRIPVSGHDGWWMQAQPLRPDVLPRADEASARVARRWVQIAVGRGDSVDAPALAETVVLVMEGAP